MIPINDKPLTQLPIIPPAVLSRHRVREEFDNRFRACARLLQACWRERQGLPIGTYTDPTGRNRRITLNYIFLTGRKVPDAVSRPSKKAAAALEAETVVETA